MGLLDKAKGLLKEHEGQIQQGLDKAKAAVNKTTGGGPAQAPPAPQAAAPTVDDEYTGDTEEMDEQSDPTEAATEAPADAPAPPSASATMGAPVPPAPPGPPQPPGPPMAGDNG